jgi:hypothetical protein
MVDGKARLVSEIYCDGLGACIGECPTDAITIEEREAAGFDPKAVERHLAAHKPDPPRTAHRPAPAGAGHGGFSCPGSAARTLVSPARAPHTPGTAGAPVATRLGNWPVQLTLVPPTAPYFKGAQLLVSADCVPFAMPGFHNELLDGKVLVVGCPKLDDTDFYTEKLTSILQSNDIASLDVAYMEVPCCYGLVQAVQQAVRDSGRPVPVTLIRVGIQGVIQERINQPEAEVDTRPEPV